MTAYWTKETEPRGSSPSVLCGGVGRGRGHGMVEICPGCLLPIFGDMHAVQLVPYNTEPLGPLQSKQNFEYDPVFSGTINVQVLSPVHCGTV